MNQTLKLLLAASLLTVSLFAVESKKPTKESWLQCGEYSTFVVDTTSSKPKCYVYSDGVGKDAGKTQRECVVDENIIHFKFRAESELKINRQSGKYEWTVKGEKTSGECKAIEPIGQKF
jgi:hypothetical protein